jgi:molybdopterin converting factor small subunit
MERAMATSELVTVTVSFSGWLSAYFEADTLAIPTTPHLADALPDVMERVMHQARRPIPQGGMHIFVNGVLAQKLMKENYQLSDGDEFTFVPVVAGGIA